MKMQLGQAGADGRRQVEAVPNSEWILECDQVIKAIGQEKPAGLVKAFVLETDKGYIKVDDTLKTSNPKVYAGGDCIRSKGEAMTVTATQDGKIAARSIHEQLSK